MKTLSLTATVQGKTALADAVTRIAWSPQGDYLSAVSAAGELLLYRWLDRGLAEPISLLEAKGEAVNTLAFSAHGRFLAAAGQAGELWIWDLQASEAELGEGLGFSPAVNRSHRGIWLDQLAWHPSLPWLAYGVGHHVEIWDMDQQSSLAQLDFQASSALHLAWHPQGNCLAVSGHGGLKVWDAEDWSQAPKRIDVPGASLFAAWSADGHYLASGNLDRTLTVAEWGCPPPWLMQGFPGKVRQVAWAAPQPGAAAPLLAAACAEGITVWRRSAGAQAAQGRSAQRQTRQGDWTSRVLQQHRETVSAIAFQPHSQLLASASQDGTIGLWHQGQSLAQTLKGFREGATCLAWQGSGQANGPLLAAGGKAGELRIWKIATRAARGFG